MKKILIAGDFSYYIYERAVIESLQRLGETDIQEFHFKKYYSNIIGKVEKHFVFIGICTFVMNFMLWLKSYKEKPNVLFIWRGTMIHPFTLWLIKKTINTTLVSYNNDDPFSEHYKKNLQRVSWKNRINQRRLWTYFIKGLPLFDMNFVYREKNIEEYKAAGAKKVKLFMPYYIPSQLPTQQQAKVYDIVFIGHYENDHRAACIDALCQAKIPIVIFGTRWENKLLHYAKAIRPIYEKEYYETISKAKIALVFMSKRNNDEYTRRCFEIPACGTMMLSERTPSLQRLYKENDEIVFFDTPDDLVQKATYYLQNNRYETIGKNSKNRAAQSGYDIDSRVKQLLNDIFE